MKLNVGTRSIFKKIMVEVNKALLSLNKDSRTIKVIVGHIFEI